MTGDGPRLDHLWSGWRHSYIDAVTAPGDRSLVPDEHGSLFERILALGDDEGFIVHRGPSCSVLLNAYPYTSGHALVVPNRAVADPDDLAEDELIALSRLVRTTVTAIRTAYRCDGINVGMNIGRAAGAGVPSHLHVHVLPRWDADSNFMTSVASARVLPEPLDVTLERLRRAWPA